MENSSKKLVDYVQEISKKIIDCYQDDEYNIEVDYSGSIQIKGIRFLQAYQTKELEKILPIVFERGAERAGKKLNLMIQQYEHHIKKGQT